ncbi:hypothetical protein DH2020_049381 [Rehmannia glutinosa]|uniref:Ubiquitinyl hydrolase 1 n=1 Tax=Rehmannia glutinosa TaxID=99300 RepID=A0ABR0U453_REHGL
MPRCSFCSGHHGRLFMCLICSSVNCCTNPESNHALLHTKSFVSHEIAIDMERAELYCCVCCDQVYDPDFDRAVVCKHLMGLNGLVGGGDLRLNKRKRLDFGCDLDLKSSKRMVLRRKQRSKSCVPLGLRGLNNLGNTCFMNSVLQALIHAPPLRDYFLSDRHNHESCRKGASSVDQLCLPCDMDVIFSNVFSGERTPYSPAKFLYSWWQHSENLASYEQQDAHEFFISMLDRIHEKLGKASPAIKENGDCQCIAHRVFSGLLRSDVTCTSCGFTSSTFDPCMDISLDLDTDGPFPKNLASKPNKTLISSSLAGCLDRFTRPEKLGSDQKLYCENCHEKHDALKQMSLKKLPLGEETDVSTEFEVFAVVTHSGMLESGHYVTYLRLRNQWYKCDDAWITEVDEEVVRGSQCYLIFYAQRVFYHKGTEDVSCQPLSTRADPFVPIAGCC